MGGKLEKEIRQSKPFQSREEEAFLNLGRTWALLQDRTAVLLKRFDLTPTQYNMLRILRGAGSEGITCSQATERMITPDPDVTRLLDRLENRQLITRERSRQDRRVVMARIAPSGLELVNAIDEPLQEVLRNNLGHVGPRRLSELIATLEELRAAVAAA